MNPGMRIAVLLSILSSLSFAASRPNVVLIVSDDQAWTDFGFMNHPVVKTPNLDRLASQSCVFANGYVPTSLCRPSLASMLTGLYPHQHKICCNDPPEGISRDEMLHFIRDVPTVPRLLAQAGYSCLQTGKWWEGHYSNGGFTHGMTTKGRHGEEGLAIGRQTMQPIYDFIDQCGDRPFFIWYAPMMPHEPHDPPSRFLEKYAVGGRNIHVARYFAMCEWFDETCGALLDYLGRKSLGDRTLVAFIVDNGWIQLEASPETKRAGFAPRSKRTPYEGGVRTPVLLRWPGRITSARRTDLVSSIDLAPTILRACGIEPPKAMSGLNLLEAAAGRTPLSRQAVFGEIYVHTATNLINPAMDLTHRWIRQGNWKLILPVPGDAHAELYDLGLDPLETNDLAAGHVDRVTHLTNALDAWWPGR